MQKKKKECVCQYLRHVLKNSNQQWGSLRYSQFSSLRNDVLSLLTFTQILGGGLVTESCPTLVTPWILACQAPLPMGRIGRILQARILEWVPFPSSGDLPDPEIKARPPALQADSSPTWATGEYQLSHQGSPRILEWVAYPFSSGSSPPRNWTRVFCFAARLFTS